MFIKHLILTLSLAGITQAFNDKTDQTITYRKPAIVYVQLKTNSNLKYNLPKTATAIVERIQRVDYTFKDYKIKKSKLKFNKGINDAN